MKKHCLNIVIQIGKSKNIYEHTFGTTSFLQNTCYSYRYKTQLKVQNNLELVSINFSFFVFFYGYFQADEEEKDHLKIKIETAIAALNDPPQSPMSV